MRFFWKTKRQPLGSHAAWRFRITKNNRRQGTSAPTLAALWAGPLELFGGLQSCDVLADLALERVVVERESRFDQHSGPRNHDLVAHGQLPNGERVVVCVEAKAGETLGETVKQYRKRNQAKRRAGESTNAPERLRDLLAKYVPDHDPESNDVGRLRYQLLSALAGTEVEAAEVGADHAVLMVHEFLTDQRPKERTSKNTDDLRRLCTLVLKVDLPDRLSVPWCRAVPAPDSMPAKLYLAWAATDLRTATLEANATPAA